jgi:hypothetical protein
LQGWPGAANGGGGAARLGDARRGMGLTGEARMSARREREGTEDGRHKPKRKMDYLVDTKGARARWTDDGDGSLRRESGLA